jgi:hypothetical protein
VSEYANNDVQEPNANHQLYLNFVLLNDAGRFLYQLYTNLSFDAISTKSVLVSISFAIIVGTAKALQFVVHVNDLAIIQL